MAQGKKAIAAKGFSKGNPWKLLKEEFNKISWTPKEDLRVCVKIVLGCIFALGIGIYAIDLFLRGTLQGLTRLTHLLG